MKKRKHKQYTPTPMPSPKKRQPMPSPKRTQPKRLKPTMDKETLKLWKCLCSNAKNLGITDCNKILDLNKVKIKKNYHVQIKKWHPDRNLNRIDQATEMTKKIITSYKWLIKNYERTVVDLLKRQK